MTTEAECIAALHQAAEKLGKSPTKAEYEELGLQPASATIIRVVGGWNKAKERAELETSPSTGSRVGPKPENVDLPDEMSWENLSVDQRWHYRNVEWNTERTLHRRAKLRAWVNDCKHERDCVRCETDNPACLDYHHWDGTNKEMAVGKMITNGYGKDRLREEMVKCEVLCANCHRREHADRRVDGSQRWVRNRKQEIGGCSRCDVSDPVCLDFHHVKGNKESTVARLVADDRSIEVISAEMAKCRVLCANCHRKEHHVPPME